MTQRSSARNLKLYCSEDIGAVAAHASHVQGGRALAQVNGCAVLH